MTSSLVHVPYAPLATPPLPRDQKFSVVIADPAWRYGNTKSRGAAENHYPTMANSEIVFLPVNEIVADDAFLFMWVTDVHLLGTNLPYSPALHAIRQWGFEPKVTIPWIKTKADVVTFDDGFIAPADENVERQYVEVDYSTKRPRVQIGMGNYLRHCHELCILATRGKPKTRVRNIPSAIFGARGQHSRKPDVPLDWAEQMIEGPYLEMFARRGRAKWTSWGNQAPPDLDPDYGIDESEPYLERAE